MEENYVGGSVSKSYSRMKQAKYKGISLKTWTVVGIWIIVSLVIIYPLTLFDTTLVTKAIAISMTIVWWIVYFKFGRNNRVIERTIVHFKFVMRAMRGETDIAKFVQDNTFLEKFLPIKKVHEDGFIQYLDGTWGVMLKIRATRISGDMLLAHLEGIRHLLDGLYDLIYVTVISTTVLDHVNLLTDKILDKSKATSSVPQKEHLVDLHNMIDQNNTNYKGHEICIIVNLGPHSTLDDANIAREGFVPGYIDALKAASCQGHIITSDQEIYQEYRKKFNPMGV